MWKNIVETERPQMTIWGMRIACLIPKATNTHSEYVVLFVFPLQQWLHERGPILRHTHIAWIINSVPDGSDWSIWHLQPFDLQAYRSQYPLKAVQTSYDCSFNGESFSDSSVIYPIVPVHCRMRSKHHELLHSYKFRVVTASDSQTTVFRFSAPF